MTARRTSTSAVTNSPATTSNERATAYIDRIVNEAPPLSRAQRDRLALLLRGPVKS